MITIECLRCEESIKTQSVEKAVAFDREHRQSCPPEGPSENPTSPAGGEG